jgi:hypothetical protein
MRRDKFWGQLLEREISSQKTSIVGTQDAVLALEDVDMGYSMLSLGGSMLPYPLTRNQL